MQRLLWDERSRNEAGVNHMADLVVVEVHELDGDRPEKQSSPYRVEGMRWSRTTQDREKDLSEKLCHI